MSKLGCKCGHVIVDQTDSLPYKASLFRDQAENAFWDEMRLEIEPLVAAAESQDTAAIAQAYGEFGPWVNTAENVEGRIGSIHARRLTAVYECQGCGRLWLEKTAGGGFVSFIPEEGGYQAILSLASVDTEARD